MGNQDDPRYKYQRNRETMLQSGEIDEQDKDAITEYLDSIDPENLTKSFRNDDGEKETKSTNTLRTYVFGLKRVAEVSDTPLHDAGTDEINELMSGLKSGSIDHPDVKDGGYAKSYLKPWQAALKGFYRYHDAYGVDADEIAMYTQQKSSVDERDMYTREEVEQLRNAVDNARNRCMLELFLNTGQRLRAIQTLRVKDIDTEEGVYYLNEEVEGLKGADENGKKRPLLGAKRAVHDWLQYHPCSDDPDSYLICPDGNHNWAEAGSQLTQSTIRHTLKKIADNADVDKPPNPHNFRHYFVTLCKRTYEMDDATIKFLIGHGSDSSIMETTYQHLTDEDHIKKAEIAANLREEEGETSPLTPEVCPTCGDHLAPDAKACAGCGAVFTPDAQAVDEQIDEDLWQSKGEAETDEEESAVDQLKEILEENPDLKAELLE